MQDTFYHKFLRMSALLFAVILLFESGFLFEGTKDLSDGTFRYMASVVGITASVQPTELNEITAELTKRKTELDEREEALREREIDARAYDTSGIALNSDLSTYIVSAILFIMLVLIVLNYVFDLIRERRKVMAHANTA